MCSTKLNLAMIFNEIKCHVNTSFGLVGGCIPCTPLCPRLVVGLIKKSTSQKSYFTLVQDYPVCVTHASFFPFPYSLLN